MAGVAEQFPFLLEELKRELKRELLEEMAAGQWLDQHQSVLGRNIHVRACQRLIRRDSPDAYHDGTDGRWLLRASAVDREIVRRNRVTAARLLPGLGQEPQSAPPADLGGVRLAKTEPEDETGIYASGWLERMRGQR